MGYNENQYSLTRWIDLHVSRAGMFDDSYFTPVQKTPLFAPFIYKNEHFTKTGSG
jgi:hypothetical protein